MRVEGRNTIRIGSRGSDLALWQAHHVADLLRSRLQGAMIEIVIVVTTGDRILDSPLPEIGGKGVFTKEIEEALLARRIDLAVHSLKDLPTILPDGLLVGAVLSRADPRDVLISRSGLTLAGLAPGARIGTSSLRRRAQIAHARRDLAIQDLRGNVPTRLRKALSGDLDAIVLARAGLERLALLDHVTEVLPVTTMLPAPGQGALGIEVVADAPDLSGIIAGLEDARARAETTAERSFLEALGGGCQVPVGALGRVSGADLVLDGVVAEPDGSILLRGRAKGRALDASAIGRSLADDLLSRGAGGILARASAASPTEER